MKNKISPKGQTKYGLKTIQEYKISFMKNKKSPNGQTKYKISFMKNKLGPIGVSSGGETKNVA